MPVGKEIDLFLRKIDCGFDVEAQCGEFLKQLLHRSGELAVQCAQRGSGCLLRAAVNEIRYCLGLSEIEFSVQERAAGKLAGFGTACAELYGGIDNCGDDQWPTVTV